MISDKQNIEPLGILPDAFQSGSNLFEELGNDPVIVVEGYLEKINEQEQSQ